MMSPMKSDYLFRFWPVAVASALVLTMAVVSGCGPELVDTPEPSIDTPIEVPPDEPAYPEPEKRADPEPDEPAEPEPEAPAEPDAQPEDTEPEDPADGHESADETEPAEDAEALAESDADTEALSEEAAAAALDEFKDFFVFDLDVAFADIPAEDPPATASDVAAAMDEIGRLRHDVLRLEQSISALADTMVARLEEENRELRRELQRMYALHAEDDPQYSPSDIPRRGRDLFEAIHRNVDELRDGYTEAYAAPPQVAEAMEPISAIATAEAGAVRYSIVREWGRTAEEAAGIGDNVSSLKGMVCAVPDDTSESALLSLGRALRQKFDEYDNINIEVFNDLEAAWRYAEENVAPENSRLMAVSRHRSSQRDSIVLFDGSDYEEIPYGAAGN